MKNCASFGAPELGNSLKWYWLFNSFGVVTVSNNPSKIDVGSIFGVPGRLGGLLGALGRLLGWSWERLWRVLGRLGVSWTGASGLKRFKSENTGILWLGARIGGAWMLGPP